MGLALTKYPQHHCFENWMCSRCEWEGPRGKEPCSISFFVTQIVTGACSVPAPVQSDAGNGDGQTQSLPLGALSIDRTGTVNNKLKKKKDRTGSFLSTYEAGSSLSRVVRSL